MELRAHKASAGAKLRAGKDRSMPNRGQRGWIGLRRQQAKQPARLPLSQLKEKFEAASFEQFLLYSS